MFLSVCACMNVYHFVCLASLCVETYCTACEYVCFCAYTEFMYINLHHMRSSVCCAHQCKTHTKRYSCVFSWIFYLHLWSCVRKCHKNPRIPIFPLCNRRWDELIWREGNYNRGAEASGTANKASVVSYAEWAPSHLLRRETAPITRQQLQNV